MDDKTLKDQQDEQEFAAAFAEDEPSDASAPADDRPAEKDPDGEGSTPVEAPPEEPGTEENNDGGKPEEKGLSELEKKAHGYDSMMGRLQAEQRKRQELEARLAALESDPAKKQAAPEPTPVSVPDEIKEDVATLQKRDPHLAAIVLEDSTDGAKLRKALEEYGADYAEERAATIKLRRDLESKLASIEAKTAGVVEQTATQAFYAQIGAKHPDWVELATDQSRAAEFSTFMDGVRSWAETKPFKEGQRLFQIIEAGTPGEVNMLLDQYKNDQAKPSQPKPKGDAAAAMAVPTRSGTPPTKPLAPKDDFDAAFREAPDQ